MAINGDTQAVSGLRTTSPLDWLTIWSIEYSGGITDEWLASSQCPREEAEALVSDNPGAVTECRQLHRVSRSIDLPMLFTLLRARLSEMMAAAVKPADIKCLQSCMERLPGARDHIKSASPVKLPDGQASKQELEKQRIMLQLAHPNLNRQQRRLLERNLEKLAK